MIWPGCAAAVLALSTPAVLVAQAAEGGRGALRPFVHVLLAYGIGWIIVLLWVWWIARSLKRVNNGVKGGGSAPLDEPGGDPGRQPDGKPAQP